MNVIRDNLKYWTFSHIFNIIITGCVVILVMSVIAYSFGYYIGYQKGYDDSIINIKETILSQENLITNIEKKLNDCNSLVYTSDKVFKTYRQDYKKRIKKLNKKIDSLTKG